MTPYNYFAERFPFTLGCSDQVSSLHTLVETSGTVFQGGFSSCTDFLATSASQTAVIQKTTASSQSSEVFIADSSDITDFVLLEALPSGGFMALAKSSANSAAAFLFVLASDMTVSQSWMLDSSTYSSLSALDVDAFRDHQLFAAGSSSVFWSPKLSDDSEVVVFKGGSALSSADLDWRLSVKC